MADNEPPVLTVITTGKTPGMRGTDEAARKIVEKGIPLDKLHEGFTHFLESIQHIVDAEQPKVGDFLLEEITFSAEIGADGEFKLLGAGVGISATSGIAFTLRRQAPNPT